MQAKRIVRIIAGERHTPIGLAERLGALALLESSSFQRGKERYSILLLREAFKIEQRDTLITWQQKGKDKKYRIDSRARDILDVCQYFADQHADLAQDFPFPAGGIGYLSYEFSRFCDRIHFAPKPDPLALPDACFIYGHVFLVFDHYTDSIYLIGLNYREASVDLEHALDEIEKQIQNTDAEAIIEQPQETNPDPLVSGGDPSAATLEETSDKDEGYKEGVAALRREIMAGNLLQGVMSRRLTLYSSIKALDAYRKLRSANPSPYLFYLDFGAYQLFGSSPEVHVRVKNGKALLRPIAGTRRRGQTREQDLALEAELLADPKERAEHLMLVDLGRNDLGRVCAPGSVKVTEYMVIERYSHVMHIVSQVEGQLAEHKTGIDALRATFPAGTVSGAPKIRAIEVLSRLEPKQRRFYAGAVGYIEPGGNLDSCIAIRTGLKMGKTLVLQAGAGVVFDSNPERELEETREKMAALLRAVGLDPTQVQSSNVQPVAKNTDSPEDDVSFSTGFSASGTTLSVGAQGKGNSSASSQIQNKIDNLIEERDQAQHALNLRPGSIGDEAPASGELTEDGWGGEEVWGDKDPVPISDDPHLESWDPDKDPSMREPDQETAKSDEEIIPLDWDFDPASAGSSKDIQDDIDALIAHRTGVDNDVDVDELRPEDDADGGRV